MAIARLARHWIGCGKWRVLRSDIIDFEDDEERNEWIKEQLDGTPDRYIKWIIRSHFEQLNWSRGIGYEDLIQECWIKLIELAERYDQSRDAKFSTFAYPLLHGHIKNTLTKELSSPTGVWWDLEETSKPSYNDPKDYWTVEEKTRHFEKEARLDFIIEKLSERQQKIVKMRMDGYTQEEIANSDQIDISQQHVSRLLEEAKDKIKEIFKIDV